MNWMHEQYQNERNKDQVREAQHNAEVDALLNKHEGKGKPKKVRSALGSKLVEWGERLQDAPHSSKPATSKI